MEPIRVTLLTNPVLDSLGSDACGRGDGQAAPWLPQFAKAAIAQDRIQYTWISLRRDLRKRRKERLGNQTFIELPQLPASLDIRTGFHFTRKTLLKELARCPADIIHCWGTEHPNPSVLGHVKQPTILSMNGVIGALAKRSVMPEGNYWKRLEKLESKWLRLADLVTTESEWASREVKSIAPDAKTMEIAYGVHPSFYDVVWSPDPVKPSLICVGTVSKGKGSDVLVSAFEQLGQTGTTLHMVGDGPLRAELEARNIPGIIWHGQLGWKDLQALLSTSWCLVHPTLADSNPNAVKEARVVGLPVITTRHGGQAEYLRNRINAWIVDSLNPDSLSSAIAAMISGFLYSGEADEKGHHSDREQFAAVKSLEGFNAAYESLT